MADLYFNEGGDLRVAPNGDLAITEDNYRHLSQQAYLRLMTQVGDHLVYPRLGANLQELFGMPQSEATGEHGKRLIKAALEREGVFAGMNTIIQSVPIGPQSIRFDVYVRTNAGTRLILSITRNLSTRED